MRIQHNIMAMNAYRNYNNNVNAMKSNLEKLSSGYKINRAGDDAAGLAISEKMRAQITGLSAAQKNVKDGISLVQTAEGAMQEVQDMLNRMVYLATQSANGTYDNEVDRANLQKEVSQLKSEIDRISDSANFNGIKLLDGSWSETGKASSANFDGWDSIKGSLAAGLTDVDAVKAKNVVNMGKFTTADATGGEKFTLTLATSDGKQHEFTVTAKLNADGTAGTFVDDDGNELGTFASPTSAIADANVHAAFTKLLQNSELGETYDISYSSGNMTFEAKTAGAGTANITAVGMTQTDKDGKDVALATAASIDKTVANNVKGADAYQALDLSQAVVFDGSNLDKAAFELNGEKFAFVATGKLTDENIAKLKEAGITHYVELAATAPNSAEVADMVNKIKLATGLDVEAGEVDGGEWKTGTPANNTYIKIKDGSSTKATGGLRLQIGDTPDDFNQLNVVIGDIHVKALGIADVDISDQDGAAAAIDKIKAAINYVSGIRGDLGANQNRLEHTANNLAVMQENIQDAESTIRDTDVADEMMAYTKNNILIQSAQAMLAQANQIPQGVLQLLQ